jgi:3-hydroxyisobutyrate dehydrogenase-like beta-hydroxyacid dehydrogenase
MEQSKTPVAVIGLGPMGQALARAFLEAGHRTTVWNRTPDKADAVVARGAGRAVTVQEAVQSAPLVVVCLIDDGVVHATLDPVVETLKGRTLVNFTSSAPAQARTTAKWAADAGVAYLDGAILTPTPSIGGPAAAVLYSGPEEVYREHETTLAALGGVASYLGDDPSRAAAYDVALLDLFWNCVNGVVHSLALARAEGIAARDLVPYAKPISGMLPGMIEGFAERLDEGRHPGDRSTIASAAAGIHHILDSAQAHGLDVGVLTASQAVLRRALDAGYGTDGLSRLSEVIAAGDKRA